MAEGIDLGPSVRSLIDVGASWRPDAADLSYCMGFLLFLLFCFCMGRGLGFVHYLLKTGKSILLLTLLEYYIYLQMLSLPIGSFLRVSSSNKLILASLLLLIFKKKLKKSSFV